LIQVTTDIGATWQNVTPPVVGPWSRLTTVEASHFDASSAYASVDRHQLQDFEPYIYRTRDMGKSWQPISAGLPRGVYVHVIKEDPGRRGLLFAGTERGTFLSLDDGDHWQPFQLNLPVTSVRDFEIYGNDLIVATHGRGFWVIDDISPLRQLTDAVLAEDVHLFKPADAFALAPSDDNGTPLQKDEPQAPNAPDGAMIDYYLKGSASGRVMLEIVDANGTVVRTFSTDAPAAPETGRRGRPAGGIPNVTALWRPVPEPFSGRAGLHRVVWDLMPPRTDRGRAGTGPLLTGTFTARLTANGKTLSEQFTVKPDPRIRSG
jgi:hypothetical protein